MNLSFLMLYCGLSFVNVVMQTVKSLCTVKCSTIVSATVNAIAYGLFNMSNFCIYSNKLTLVEEVDGFSHKCYPFSSTWEGI